MPRAGPAPRGRTLLAAGVALAAAVLLLSAAPLGAEGRRHGQHRNPRVSSRSRHGEAEAATSVPPMPAGEPCLGEFQVCPTTGDCVLNAADCGSCSRGQYRCPLSTTCVSSAAEYMTCPNLAGTVLDWNLPVEQRIDALLAKMNLADQILQLQNNAPAAPEVGLPSYNWLNDDVHAVRQPDATVFPDGCGLGATMSTDALFAVGYLIGIEARGTHNTLVHDGNRGQTADNNGVGITTYAPNLNLVRDPRWGRAQEVYGEDPHLTSRLTVAYVQGQQGINETEQKYMLAGSCCKHWAAYDIEDIPIDRKHLDAQVNTRDMWESFSPAFEACVTEAKASSVMCSYNAINGVPTCADPNLLNGILRDRWNFTGFVVSDYDAWADIATTYQYCPSNPTGQADIVCAAAVGINAGMDQEGGGSAAVRAMPAAVINKSVAPATIGMALRRLMRTRIALGMLDPPTLVAPFNWLTQPADVQSAAHHAWAREVARQSMSLYKNANSALPITLDASPRLALVGGQWTDAFLLTGNYARRPTNPGVVSLLAGVWHAQIEGGHAQVPCTKASGTAYQVKGQTAYKAWTDGDCAALCASAQTDSPCAYYTWTGPDSSNCYLNADASHAAPANGVTSGQCKSAASSISWAIGCVNASCPTTEYFPAAVKSTAGATHVLVSLGLSQQFEYETGDRSAIELPGQQYELVRQLRAAMKPAPAQKLICVFVHGGTFALRNLATDCDAILDAWYPGSQGGAAAADVLFGFYSPAGRTTVTWYNETSDLPPQTTQLDWYPNATTGSQGVSYRYFTGQPVLPFGFGLSYSSFAYVSMQSPAFAGPCDPITVTVSVQNIGAVDSDEVVQLYVRQPSASVPAPQVRLAAFQRLHLQAGAPPTSVTLTVAPAFHSVVLDDNKDNFWAPRRRVEQGSVELHVGGGQPGFYAGSLSANVQITGEADLDLCGKQ